MDDQTDYRALYLAEVRRREATESTLKATERTLKATKTQISKTTFPEFLDICHHSIFLKLKVERNALLATPGGLARVDGKLYPRYLKPWADFGAQHEASFAVLEEAFRRQPPLLPSPAGLDYLASKVGNKKLAGKKDLRDFECLAVEGCVLDVLLRFLELVESGVAAISSVDAPSTISFSNYPFGVIATNFDEEASETESDRENERSVRRRSRNLSRPGVGSKDNLAKSKEDRSGSQRKRQSSEQTLARPDRWCFRHYANDTVRPLFVVEYKAPHKVDEDLLRSCLVPDTAASLMEDTIRALSSTKTNKDEDEDEEEGEEDEDEDEDEDVIAKRDISKVFSQVYHYMVDYRLQYSYVTTGFALIFFYLDPAQPSTLYYHLEEPKRKIGSSDPDDLKHSAVALVLSFVLMAMTGKYMTNRWRKTLQKEQPRWPAPYADMDVTPDKTTRRSTVITLAPSKAQETAESGGEP